MRVVVRHGHFAFYPLKRSDALHFQRVFKLPLFAEDDYYTLEALVGLPRWSQIGALYGGLPAVVTYEGRKPWEVMRENGFVYSLAYETLVPRLTVTDSLAIPQSRDYAVAPKPLIQPGAILTQGLFPGDRILGYQGDLDLDTQRLYIGSQETLL